jgi:hypothetical protein
MLPLVIVIVYLRLQRKSNIKMRTLAATDGLQATTGQVAAILHTAT